MSKDVKKKESKQTNFKFSQIIHFNKTKTREFLFYFY